MMYDFDASQIESWAGRQDARGILPRLVRRLLKATLSEANYKLKMPDGSSVDDPEWDGVLEVDRGNQWAPDGVSGWELSCGKGITGKANKNYRNRTGNPLEIDREDATFVFVTPRKWRNKEAWAKERNAEGMWRCVRAYDADDLVSWLEESTEVSKWFAGVLGGVLGFSQIDGKLDSIFNILNNGLGRQVKQIGAESVQDPRHQEVLEIIDTANKFVHEGHIITAKGKLREVEDEVTRLPDKVRFRYLTTLAGCEIEEGRDDEAVALINEAHGIQPEHPTGITNASLAARIQKITSKHLSTQGEPLT